MCLDCMGSSCRTYQCNAVYLLQAINSMTTSQTHMVGYSRIQDDDNQLVGTSHMACWMYVETNANAQDRRVQLIVKLACTT